MLAMHREQLISATAAGTLRWVGYLSSTGVYGDHGGAWVDETAALRVTPAAGKPWHRAQAEAEWLRLHAEHGVPVHVFRLGGIYGALLGSRLGDTSQPHQARAAACWMCGAGRRVRRRGRAGRSGTSPAATWRTL